MALPSVPAGFQYTTLTQPGGGWDSRSVPYNQTPAVVTGDTLMTPLLSAQGHPVIPASDGLVAVDTGSSSARQLLVGVDIFDVSADAFIGADTFSMNDLAPVVTPFDGPIILREDQAMTALDLAAQFGDPELDLLTFAITTGSPPTGTDVDAAGQMTGNPTTEGSGSFGLTGTDPYGQSVTLTVDWEVIDQVMVPDVNDAGTAEGDALAEIAAAFLVGATTYAYSALIPFGEVISQNPAPDTLVDPGTTVTITVSRGEFGGRPSGFDFGLGLGVGFS